MATVKQVDAAMITDLAVTFGRVYERCPAEVETVRSFVSERINRSFSAEKAKVSTDAERYALVGRVFAEIFPEAMKSEKCKRAAKKMLAEYAKLPSTPATQLEGTPGANTLLLAVGLGFGIGGVIVGVACLVIWAW